MVDKYRNALICPGSPMVIIGHTTSNSAGKTRSYTQGIILLHTLHSVHLTGKLPTLHPQRHKTLLFIPGLDRPLEVTIACHLRNNRLAFLRLPRSALNQLKGFLGLPLLHPWAADRKNLCYESRIILTPRPIAQNG